MKVAILGANGQLGHILSGWLRHLNYEVKDITRANLVVDAGTSYDDYVDCLDYLLEVHNNAKYEYIINCIGATKPHFNNKAALADNIYTNAVFPHLLQKYASKAGIKVIHITTDCVFSGTVGKYNENSPHDPLDEYGKSKSLGECQDSMVIRTSIIGTEENRGTKRFLIEWLRSNDGKGEVNGFTNHLWNGLTTLELSKAIAKIIKNDLWSPGTYILHSDDINKADLLREIATAFNINVSVKDTIAKESCDRTMRSVKKLNVMLKPVGHRQMLKELAEWEMSTANV